MFAAADREWQREGIMRKTDNHTDMKSEQFGEATAPYVKPGQCLLCGQMGPALLYGHWICDHCKNLIQADALAKRRQLVKEGGGPSGL